MSKESHECEVSDSCKPSNLGNTDLCTHQMPPPPPEYNQVYNVQARDMVLSPPYAISNPEMFQNPPNYNPTYPSDGLSGANPPQFHPNAPMGQGMMPPSGYPPKSSFPNPGYFNPAQPMVVTTQPTGMVASSPAPVYKDYLPWSILNIVFCCLLVGIVALIFSLQTRSAVEHQDWESARKKSCLALLFNVISLILGIILIIGIVVYYIMVYTTSYLYYG